MKKTVIPRRISYSRDVVQLTKLVCMIEEDKTRPVEWRQAVIYDLNEAIAKLQEASVESMGNGGRPSGPRARDVEREVEEKIAASSKLP